MKKFYFPICGVVAFLLTMGAIATVFRSNMIETPLQAHSAEILAIAPNTNYTPDLPEIKVIPSQQINSDNMVQTSPPGSYPRQPLDLRDTQLGSDFYQFRQRLREAVRRRDANFIRSTAIPGIRLTFGDPKTLDDLNIDNPKAEIWLGMEKAFSTGCAYDTQTWICPHVFHVFEVLPLDPFDYFAIVGVNVNARSQPSTNSQIVGVLSNEVVKYDYQATGAYNLDNPNSWTPIVLPNGRRGYVLNRYVYSPIGYRGFFKKVQGKWKMITFVAGD